MINPKPVDTPQSPYRNGSQVARPIQLSTVGSPPAGGPSPKKTSRRFRWKRTFGLVFLGLIAGATTYTYAQYRNLTNNIIQEHQGDSSEILKYDPNANTQLDTSKFVKSGDGRFNMVIVGIGGENHPGGNLTDSIQVMSMDTLNHTVAFTSVPRDLYVTYPGIGRTKINAVYTYAEQKKTGDGAVALRTVIGQVLGVKVSNFALIDFTGIKDIVDSIGGIEVDVPKALNDPLYPAADMIHYDPLYVKAGLQTMNGEMALKYARSRETTSDFDRSMRQQIVIAAIKKKALSIGVLTNPTKITNIIAALGKHFRTDLQVDEIRTLIDVYRQVAPESTGGFVLDTSSALGLLTSVSSPVYYAYPIPGFDRYDDINQWFAKNNPDPLLKKDTPTVTVYNSGKATQKQMDTFVQKLKDYGYTVTLSTEIPTGKTPATRILSSDPNAKPISHNYLGSLLNTTVEKGKISSSVTTDFEVIYVPTSTSASLPATLRTTPSPSPQP